MASKPSIIPLLLPEDELVCSICQALIKDPVTTPCGHNFCKGCLQKHWGKISSAFYCPHCRRKFISMPVLQPNTVLCSIMEHVVKVWPEPELCSDEERASCDVCEEGRTLPAVKTCVTCMASFCSVHVRPHAESQALMKHSLCAPVMDIKELQCKKHGKGLEMFCMTHRVAVCWQCSSKHRNCNVRVVEDMRNDWKASIDPVAEEAQEREGTTDEALRVLDTLTEGVKAAAEQMREEVELCFDALRDTIESAQDRVTAFIKVEEVEVLQQIEDHQKQQDKHRLAISRIMDQIDEYRDNDSYFNFCLSLPSLPPEVSQLHVSDVQLNDRELKKIVLDLKNLNKSLESQLCSILERREELQKKDLALDSFAVISGRSRRRCKLLKYSCEVTFDPNTASASVILSEDSLVVTVQRSGFLAWKDYQVNMEMGFRVLCSQNFAEGQHYWEISPPRDRNSNWAVGVTYKNGQERYQSLGRDKSSWCVRWQNAREREDKETCASTESSGCEEEISRSTQTKKRDTGDIRGPKLESTRNNGAHSKKFKGEKLEGCLLHKHKREVDETFVFDGVADASERVEEKRVNEDKTEPAVTKECIVTTRQEEDNKATPGFFASHNQEMHLIGQEPPGRIGVHLDCDRGWLSFFIVTDSKLKLCYRFQALFSAPLYPAVWLRDPEKTMTISKGAYTANNWINNPEISRQQCIVDRN